MKKWFDQPLQEKLKTENISDAHGWVAKPWWDINNTDIV
jgi:hypothetical protein